MIRRLAHPDASALLMSGDAALAEKVFREDFDRNPRNPRIAVWPEARFAATKTRLRRRIRPRTARKFVEGTESFQA